MSKVDLHIHSSFSDGSDDIDSLTVKIVESGVHTFALTDHDTVAGCTEMEKIVPSNIEFIKGVELTCTAKTVKCHILGYNCDCNNKTLLALIERGKTLRKNKLDKRIKHLKQVHGIELSNDELMWLESRTTVVKTHIAELLVKRGLENNLVDAMEKYLNDCDTDNMRFSAEEAIFAIERSGGVPVWAHPLGGEGEPHIEEKEFLSQLEIIKSCGIKGLECFYSRYNRNEALLLTKAAERNHLLISGGSDYHGMNKDIPIGLLDSDGKNIDYNLLTVLNLINLK